MNDVHFEFVEKISFSVVFDEGKTCMFYGPESG